VDTVTALVVLLGLACGACALLAVAAGLGVGLPERAVLGAREPLADRLERLNLTTGRMAAAAAAGLLVAVLTRWPVAAVLAGAAWLYVPRVVAGGAAPADVARLEAVAAWAEMLRDTLAAAGGLQQSIVATAPIAPVAIRPELEELTERLKREPLSASLRRLAQDLDDPTADLVVSALLLAADRSPRQLAPLLGTLAGQARAAVASRLRVEAGRARTRSSVRIITLVTIGFAFGLVLLNPSYVRTYGDAAGQLVLLVIGGLFAGGLSWIGRSAKAEQPVRLLTVGAAP
jgi:tight adherence protein B